MYDTEEAGFLLKPGFVESARLSDVQAPIVPLVARWIDETPGTISLGQGLVSYGPPPEALAAARQFGDRVGDHLYTPIEGLPELIEALETKLSRDNGVRVRPDSHMVVTAGGNLAFVNAILAIADPGDEVILPVPYYFNHEMAVVMAGARPVPVPTSTGYQLDLDAIRRATTPRTRAVVTVSPNNPTGAVYPEEALRAVNAWCADRGLFHLHDEAYEYFTYDKARHFSPGSIPGAAAHTISLYSLSKTYGMASWRIGYMVAPIALRSALDKIQDTLIICAPAISQHAAIAALAAGRPYVDAQVVHLAARRRLVIDTLARVGAMCDMPRPDGALYAFIRIRSTGDAVAFAERLVRDHRVAVIPGPAFGDRTGCSMRLAYGALDRPTLADGLARLVHGLTVILTT